LSLSSLSLVLLRIGTMGIVPMPVIYRCFETQYEARVWSCARPYGVI
jgi:hypothetical protein